MLFLVNQDRPKPAKLFGLGDEVRVRLGPYEHVPTIARWVSGALPEVHRLHVPAALVREFYPEPVAGEVPRASEPADGAST